MYDIVVKTIQHLFLNIFDDLQNYLKDNLTNAFDKRLCLDKHFRRIIGWGRYIRKKVLRWQAKIRPQVSPLVHEELSLSFACLLQNVYFKLAMLKKTWFLFTQPHLIYSFTIRS